MPRLNLLSPHHARWYPKLCTLVASRSFTASAISAAPRLTRRAVAGSFLFRFPDDDAAQKPQVALFRRSGDVRNYPHKYAPISGSVEPTDANPLATAWREIQEETSLTRASLRVFRQGKPYSFVDEDLAREWSIHPFSFVLKATPAETITLDWEHESYEWLDPDELATRLAEDDFPAVPRLLDSFRRVWFDVELGKPAGKALAAGLGELQMRRESGAQEVAARALEIFSTVVARISSEGPVREKWWRHVRLAAWHLWKNGRESMGAPVLSSLLSSLLLIERRLERLSADELPAGFIDGVQDDIKSVTGEGVSSPDKMSTRANEVKHLADRFFSDL